MNIQTNPKPLKISRGTIREDGYIFWGYHGGKQIGQEYWVSPEKYEKRLEKQQKYDQKYHKANKEIIKKYNQKYYESNREVAQKYRDANKEAMKEWRDANKEKIKEYRDANKEKIKEYHQKYRDNNKEDIKKSEKKYRESNKEDIKKTKQKYRDNNKETIKETQKLSRLKRKYNIQSLEELQQILRDHPHCKICGTEFNENLKPVIDHDHSKKASWRALLCHYCNAAEGLLYSNPKTAANQIGYNAFHNPNAPREFSTEIYGQRVTIKIEETNELISGVKK